MGIFWNLSLLLERGWGRGIIVVCVVRIGDYVVSLFKGIVDSSVEG